MCGGNRDPERKKAKNKKEWCLPSHKKRFQAFRVLKFRVFGGVFLVSYRKHHLIIIIKEKKFGGCLSIVFARRTTHDKSALLRAILYRFSSLSLSLFFFFFFSGFFGCNNNNNQQKELLLRLFLCYVMWC